MNEKVVAKKRWQILGQALLKGKVDFLPAESIRAFQHFGLFKTRKIVDHHICNEDTDWYQYSSNHVPFTATIRHVNSNINSPEVLIGFNNTGNVGVWASEEVLAHYCLTNSSLFDGKTVCELGGGMTCLAGIAVWKCTNAKHVLISDGNERSVQNLNTIVEHNADDLSSKSISVKNILWDSECIERYDHLAHSFDVIICADCLFFKESVAWLAKLIFKLLSDDGLAIVVAPSRNNTFQNFARLAASSFNVKMISEYDELITKLHHENVANNSNYKPDLHHPLMLHLTKR